VNDKGYTLAEMLVALMIIGLLMAGLGRGVSLLSNLQGAASTSIGRHWEIRNARENLASLLDGRGPFLTAGPSASDFSGSPHDFKFNCGSASRCGASLSEDGSAVRLQISRPSGDTVVARLPGVSHASFLYGSDQSFGSDWPRQSDKPQALRWIFITEEPSGGPKPLFSVPVLVDQAADCQFDTITRTCRNGGE
jgi:prepilin-type N-terminal cleavage/methylation domain-containing protein